MLKKKNKAEYIEPFFEATFEVSEPYTTTVISGMIAKKDFIICHNEYFKTIKAGDDLSDIPEMYLQNLKIEQVY